MSINQMSTVEKSINKYTDLCKLVKKRLEQHEQIFSVNNQAVLKVLFESTEHLSLDEIYFNLNHLNKTTVNSILCAFESLGIVDGIVIDDVKRYELTYLKQAHYHLYCQECKSISELEDMEIHNLFLNKLSDMNFKAMLFNVIINGVCTKCQK